MPRTKNAPLECGPTPPRAKWLRGQDGSLLGQSLELLGPPLELLGASLELLGASLELRGASLELRGASLELLGASLELLGASLELRGASLELLGASLELLGASLELRGAAQFLSDEQTMAPCRARCRIPAEHAAERRSAGYRLWPTMALQPAVRHPHRARCRAEVCRLAGTKKLGQVALALWRFVT